MDVAMNVTRGQTKERAEAQAAGEKVWIAQGADDEPLLIQSESGNVARFNGGGGEPYREDTENMAYARRMVAAWNACQGIETGALEAARTGAVAAVLAPVLGKNPRKALVALTELLDLVRQASAPGGIGEHEFHRDGGWRQRARNALDTFSAVCAEAGEAQTVLSEAGRALPCHLFEIEAESEDGTMCYFVSAAGKTVDAAKQEAIAQVMCDLDEAEGSEDDVIGSVEYHGTTEREFCSHVGPYAA